MIQSGPTQPDPCLPGLAPALIQSLASLFSRLPQVEAIALGGSRSAGIPDSDSDIDLYIYTHAEIPLQTRQEIVNQAGGASKTSLGLTFWGPGDEWFHAPSGIEVDLVYFDKSWTENALHQVLSLHRPGLGYTTSYCFTVQHSTIYFDPHGWLANLQALCRQPYPEALRREIIAFNYPVLRQVIPSYQTQLKKAHKRGDLVSLNHRLAALLASYFDVIFALNRQFHPGEKRLVAYAESHCELLPENMAGDLRAVLQSSTSLDPIFLAHLTILLDALDALLAAQGFPIA